MPNDARVFTGMCGAESGSIPVTAISPTILVNKVETQNEKRNLKIFYRFYRLRERNKDVEIIKLER